MSNFYSNLQLTPTKAMIHFFVGCESVFIYHKSKLEKNKEMSVK